MLEGAVSWSKMEGKTGQPWFKWLAGYQACVKARASCLDAGTREMDREVNMEGGDADVANSSTYRTWSNSNLDSLQSELTATGWGGGEGERNANLV